MTAPLIVALVLPLLASPRTEGLPTILQQVRIGDTALAPNTGMSPPIALVHPAPQITFKALQAGVQGTVIVQAAFDIDGNFQVLGITHGLGYGLDEAALAALETWTFRPAYRSGRRVPVVASIEVEFRQFPEPLLRTIDRLEQIQRELKDHYSALQLPPGGPDRN